MVIGRGLVRQHFDGARRAVTGDERGGTHLRCFASAGIQDPNP